jgi:hypothetical protein
MPQLHRNNAAEWVMVIALSPFVWIARRLTRRGVRDRRASREPSGSAAGRRVLVEGLPPRTMN